MQGTPFIRHRAGRTTRKKYNEWSADRHGDSRKSELRRDINAAIRSADTYDEFLHLLRAKGYVVKGETLDGKSPKYISFLPPGRERFVRGSVKSLGAEYTKERIAERISERVQKRGKALTVGYTGKRLIDTSQEKFQESAGLKRWAEIENLKTAASAYSKVTLSLIWKRKSQNVPPLPKGTVRNLLSLSAE